MNRLLKRIFPLTTAAFLAGAIATPAARAFTIDTLMMVIQPSKLTLGTSPTDNDTGLTGVVGGIELLV
jgi:hypothetical protein